MTKDDEYADYNETRQRRVKIVAWVVIVSLILVGGGATGARPDLRLTAEGGHSKRLSSSAPARIETRLTCKCADHPVTRPA